MEHITIPLLCALGSWINITTLHGAITLDSSETLMDHYTGYTTAGNSDSSGIVEIQRTRAPRICCAMQHWHCLRVWYLQTLGGTRYSVKHEATSMLQRSFLLKGFLTQPKPIGKITPCNLGSLPTVQVLVLIAFNVQKKQERMEIHYCGAHAWCQLLLNDKRHR